MDFAVPDDYRIKLKESEKKDKYLNLARELKHESENYTICNWYSWYSHQTNNKGIGGLGNKRMSGDRPNYCISEISQNTEKSLGDLRRLAVTHSSEWLMWKTHGVNNNNNER